MDLKKLFDQMNQKHFDGELEVPILTWNSRLEVEAGRFIPPKSQWKFWKDQEPAIEMGAYLLEIDPPQAQEDQICIVLCHEMIHYWLWSRGRPYGHTEEFEEKAQQIGIAEMRIQGAVPTEKYLYECPNCLKNFKVKRRVEELACESCCQKYNKGVYDSRFCLRFVRYL
ncbi:MAG: hypothetical protein CL678_14975 [Bdellovibrionaceae bacterium]|nr:hypothetical protein [Pseudobdellovibrionaceae bacterium]|tara:strand:+ start:4618 stop:5124 length:507 start_codon:yes stop_codon:yes gene_type:complete